MIRIFFFLIVSIISISACNNKQIENEDIKFSSSDSVLTEAFQWAKQKAHSYVGSSTDKSGPWYEAALPEREAFCMRDVSHQCLGAEYLGLHEQNLNMMKLFVKNISESKDWCSYWEINRYNVPAPVDYRNDKEFWYNLPANFDVLQACYRLYKISGDETYIKNKDFLNFYEKTVNDYIERWQLNPGQLSTRDRYLNTPEPMDKDDYFHIARGLPSYIESSANLRVGSDLVAAIYAGLTSYANILELNGNSDTASFFRAKAKEYQQLLESKWWDENNKTYYSFSTLEGSFGHSEPVTFLLWFNAVKDNGRLENVLDNLAEKSYNVENTSYLPYLFYKYGRKNDAYSVLTGLADPNTKRRDYPEVSYGVIHGFVEGLMGIKVDFDKNLLSIRSNLTEKTQWAKLDNLQLLATTLSVKHEGVNKTVVSNSGNKPVQLKVSFMDSFNQIQINNINVPIIYDVNKHSIYCVVDSEPGNKLIIEALTEN